MGPGVPGPQIHGSRVPGSMDPWIGWMTCRDDMSTCRHVILEMTCRHVDMLMLSNDMSTCRHVDMSDPWIHGYPKSDIPRIQSRTGFHSFDMLSSETPTTHETFYHFLSVREGFFQNGVFWGLGRYTTLDMSGWWRCHES